MVGFKRDLYPQCRPGRSPSRRTSPRRSPFACTDRNGDPLTYRSPATPIAGALGAVDQAAARVFYNPFSGFLGADSVRYRATAAGLTSNEAKMAINVVAPPVPPPPRPSRGP